MIFKGDGQGELNGFLDSGSHIQGDLRFENTFRIDGQVTGTVRSAGELVVGEGGVIEGEVHVGSVYVSGTVKGQIHAAKRLEIAPKGKVYAEVRTPALVIDDGAFFEGHCSMSRGESTSDEKTPKLVKPVPIKKDRSAQ